jgi:MFS transporter, PPP family, 3-phenylpropionic acid transporter
MTARRFQLRFSLAYALMMLGTGVQLPFLPLWLAAKGISVGGIAFIVAGMMAVRVVASPLFAWIADHHGNRRQVVRVCAFLSFLCYVGIGLVDGFWPIAILALMAGFLFAPIFPLSEGFSVDASAVLGIDYGRMRLWASLSFLVGSLGSGALLTRLNALDTVWILCVAMGLCVVSTLVMPDEPPGMQKIVPVDEPRVSSGRFLFASSFPIFLLAAGLGQASHGMLNGFSSVHWASIGYSPFHIGVFWACAVVAEVVLLANSNAILERFGPGMLFLIGLAGGLVRWAGMAFFDQMGIIILLQMLHAVSFAMTHLGTMHIIRLMVPPRVRNRAQGLNAALAGGILMAGSVTLAGKLYEPYGSLAYLAMVGISLLAFTIGVSVLRFSSKVRAAAET